MLKRVRDHQMQQKTPIRNSRNRFARRSPPA
uniref:Uncharacterized protein n=1 Tax=Arundo donax TaxID=35708 RepID=A0A0A9BL43_ARUDO